MNPFIPDELNKPVKKKQNSNPVRFRHLHGEHGRITSTVATQYTDNTQSTLVYAVARCTPDQPSPSREMGRKIAGGRLKCFLNGRAMKRNVGVVSRQSFIRWLEQNRDRKQIAGRED